MADSMTLADMINAINAAAAQLIADGHTTPMTHPTMVRCQAAQALLQAGEKVAEVPQTSVTFRLPSGELIQITHDAAARVYRASAVSDPVTATTARLQTMAAESAALGLTPAQAWDRLWDRSLAEAQARTTTHEETMAAPLNGSERQISWAEEIRTKFATHCATLVERVRTGKIPWISAKVRDRFCEIVEAQRANSLEQITDAKTWIDRKQLATYSSVEQHFVSALKRDATAAALMQQRSR